jgi:hypothetical protein
MTGGWRKLHNEEFHNLYSSPNIVRMFKSRTMRLTGHVACKIRTKIFVAKPVGRRLHGRLRSRWEDERLLKWILGK